MSGNKTGLIVGIAGGVVVLLLVAAVLFANEEVGAEYGTPVIEGQGLPLMPPQSPVDETANGFIAPTVIGQDFDNNTVEIDNTDGKAKGIVFLAHWCGHCQAEVPRVQAWLDATGGVPGVNLYSVATAMNSGQGNFPPSDWLARENWSLPVIRDDQDNSVLAAYGSGGFPYWVFTNADGTVALRTAGELTIVQLEEILASLEQ
jgi:cytochrome c biogenesis protein CcmG/thiol:disulfide interchange protein DsbE